MKILICILFSFSSLFLFSQKYDTLFLFNECSFSVNQSYIPTKGHGNIGFDFGLHRVFEKEKLGNFVYGLEFSKANYYLEEVRSDSPMHYPSYYHSLSISKMTLRNSFNYRFHLDESKKVFFSSGIYLDYVLSRKGSGFHYQALPMGSGESEFKNNIFESPIMILGINAGFGFNFDLKHISIGLKPQINIHLLPLIIATSYYFDNFASFQLSVILRKIHRA